METIMLTHERPDGDAIGAALGLAAAIQAGGGRASVYLWGDLPRWFGALHRRLGGPEPLTGPYTPLPGARVALVDAGGPARCGAMLGAAAPPLALIVDHHDDPPAAADVVMVDPQATSACDLIVQRWDDLAQALGVRLALSPTAAAWLSVGMRTDTLDFSVSGVDGALLRRLARLADAGAPLADIAALLRRSSSAAHLDLQSALWSGRLQVAPDAVVMVAMADVLASSGVNPNDAKMVLYLAGQVQGLDLAVLVVEDAAAGVIRVSARSASAGRALAVARTLGGGGHPMAAGAVLRGVDLAAALPRIIAAAVEA